MNFNWTSKQLKYKHDVLQFAKSSLDNAVTPRDHQSIFNRENWQKCADFGILGLATPAAFGGRYESIDILLGTLAMEALGYGCRDNGLTFGLNAQMWTVQLPIAQFGTDTQKAKYLTALTKGKWIGCHALTEPNAGSDIFNLETVAEKVEGGYILNGSKRLITFAPIADIALVFARTNPAMGKWGITGFIIEKEMPGFSAGPVKEKMGLRTVPIGELFFKNCFVPTDNRLGAEGAGWSIMLHSLEYDRCCILASQLGAMERQLEETIAFVRKRRQFGKAIGEFQSVSNRIADMKLRIEASRLLLYKVAWLKHTGKSAMMEAALLKLYLGEGFVASSMDALRCRGGSGYLTENEIERDLRDSIGGVLYAGTSDIQRNIIAELLGVK